MEALDADADTASTFLRGLLIKELSRRELFTQEDARALLGTSA